MDIDRSVDKLESVLCRILNRRNGRLMRPLDGAVEKPPVPFKAPRTNDEIKELRPVRMQLARLWLDTPLRALQDSYENNLGKWHRRFSCSELKSYPLTLEEHEFVAQEVDCLSRSSGDSDVLQHVLAAMLYLRPYQMPITLDLERVPSWFQDD